MIVACGDVNGVPHTVILPIVKYLNDTVDVAVVISVDAVDDKVVVDGVIIVAV